MSTLACLRAMQLVERSRSGIDEADRLRLEQHLGECVACTAQAQLLAGVVEATRAVGTLDGAARQRAFSRALQRRGQAKPSQPATPMLQGVFLVGAAALAVAVLAFFVWPSKPAPELVLSTSSPDRELSAAPPEQAIELAAGQVATLERATATALVPSQLTWSAETATLTLSGGSLRLEVEPGRTVPFQVVTKDYRVEVLGTIFEVDAAEVRVERGKVRVERRNGEPMPQVLTAGERWSMAGPASEPAASADAPVSASASASATPSAAAPKNVAGILSRARALLAEGKVPAARALVEQAQASGLSPAQDAEARTLLAECSLVSGDTKDAARRYAEVASKYGDLAAGETALFAAGRTAHAAGQKAEARKIFNQYLSRYPRGQFVNEARTRLTQLGQ